MDHGKDVKDWLLLIFYMKVKFFKKGLSLTIAVLLTLGMSISLQSLLAAWAGPSSIPPNGNTFGAINVGSTGQFKLGGLILNTGASANGLIVKYGNVGIGNEAPSEKLDVNGNVRAAGFYYSSSDARLKENVRTIENAEEKIDNLRAVNFNWKNVDDGDHAGFIAQEIEKVIPEVVRTGHDGYKYVDYDGIIPYLVEGMKEQQARIKELEKRIDALK